MSDQPNQPNEPQQAQPGREDKILPGEEQRPESEDADETIEPDQERPQ